MSATSFSKLLELVKTLHAKLRSQPNGTSNLSNTISPDTGLYALIDDIITLLGKVRRRIRINEFGLIKQLASDAGTDSSIVLGSLRANTPFSANRATVDITDESVVLLGNDASTQSLSSNLTTTSRGRSLHGIYNPSMLWGDQFKIGYTEATLFCLLAEQRQVLKKLLAGNITATSGNTPEGRSVVVLSNCA